MAPKRVLFPRQLRSNFILVFLLLLILLDRNATAQPHPDAQFLINFKNSLKNTAFMADWDPARPPCDAIGVSTWTGVLCKKDRVWGLKLENMGLTGNIDVVSLSRLDNLRTVSLMRNNFQGAVPNFATVGMLKSVYLSDNQFSGQVPNPAFEGMASLKKLVLSGNRLSGMIPPALAALPLLVELRLEQNEFEGLIPNFPPGNLKVFNVSDNKLSGEIPQSLRRFDASSFSGNGALCGPPLAPCSSGSGEGPKGSGPTIIMLGILMVAVVAALLAAVIILRRRRQRRPPEQNQAVAGPVVAVTAAQSRPKPASSDVEQGRPLPPKSTPSPAAAEPNKQNVKLTFLRDDAFRFDMTDLLKASAEVLGSGVFGSTYKAALSPGKVMVVKRFKYMNNVSREEFAEHMRRLGQLRHDHVLPIVAYYYRKEEKLLVAEYMENFSLAVQLHGNHSRGRPSPNWRKRLRILKGVARGLQYLYTALSSLTAPHGHLKSSNVLLNREFSPLLTDYGLMPVVNQEHAPEHMISYRSPEFKDSRRISRKTDIWSFGILVLETLTGRFPSNLFQQGNGSDVDLATWVESVMKSGGGDGAEVLFDKEMEGAANAEQEMMKLLKIGLNCCQFEVDKRPEIRDVVEQIEGIKEKDS